jgi:hypothetical protein
MLDASRIAELLRLCDAFAGRTIRSRFTCSELEKEFYESAATALPEALAKIAELQAEIGVWRKANEEAKYQRDTQHIRRLNESAGYEAEIERQEQTIAELRGRLESVPRDSMCANDGGLPGGKHRIGYPCDVRLHIERLEDALTRVAASPHAFGCRHDKMGHVCACHVAIAKEALEKSSSFS